MKEEFNLSGGDNYSNPWGKDFFQKFHRKMERKRDN